MTFLSFEAAVGCRPVGHYGAKGVQLIRDGLSSLDARPQTGLAAKGIGVFQVFEPVFFEFRHHFNIGFQLCRFARFY